MCLCVFALAWVPVFWTSLNHLTLHIQIWWAYGLNWIQAPHRPEFDRRNSDFKTMLNWTEKTNLFISYFCILTIACFLFLLSRQTHRSFALHFAICTMPCSCVQISVYWPHCTPLHTKFNHTHPIWPLFLVDACAAVAVVTVVMRFYQKWNVFFQQYANVSHLQMKYR